MPWPHYARGGVDELGIDVAEQVEFARDAIKDGVGWGLHA